MSTFFVDTSAIAKRYLREAGSKWVRSWIKPSAGNVIVISDLTLVEMSSLMARRVREGSLIPSVEPGLTKTFRYHVEQEYLTIPIDAAVLEIAQTLVHKHILRALDGIQLACASQAMKILSEPMIFVSGDAKLLNAAAAEGFETYNPNLHP